MALFVDKLKISSPDFPPLGPIPANFAGSAENDTPRLEFSGAPDGTVEFAIICHDPDAPLAQGFTHWTVYGIPVDAHSVDLGTPGVRVGPNGVGQSGWTGPWPPPGHGIHHYYFWVYALNRAVDGAPTREEFLAEYADSIIEQARVVGTFQS
jgi:Raf kinase inhibitor-like YbhB/YbcL family protein